MSVVEADGRAACVLALLRAIQTVRREERELEAQIIEHLDAHADAHIFTSLARAGHGVRAATLLTEIGDVRSRFPDEESLAALAGVAPVTRASGQDARRRLPLRLRQEAPQRDHRLRRRLPPRQPVGGQDLNDAIIRGNATPTPCASSPAPGSA